MPHDTEPQKEARAPRQHTRMSKFRGILLASVFALGVTGIVAGEALLADTNPANAQITQVQNLSNQNNLTQKAPERQNQLSFADIVETVQPAVVSVRVKTEEKTSSLADQMPGFFRDLPPDHPLRRFFKEFGDQGGNGDNDNHPQHKQFGMAQGSGFFISGDGYIVTNNHVVENATQVEIATNDGKTYKAKVVGTDPRTDLALLKVDSKDKFPHVSFGTDVPRVGDWVVAIGNPFGLGGSVTAGIISARGRDIGAGPYDDFLQIDAAVNRGNSGGPTFNLKGEVVGVNTAIYSPSGGNVGIAFAVPAEVATHVIQELKDTGSVTRGWLGVQIQPVTDDIAAAIGLKDPHGALVVEPQEGSPGAKAGIEAGDVVLSVNGERVADARDLSRRIANIKPDTDTKLTIFRNGDTKDVTVKLGKLSENQQQADNSDSGSQNDNGSATQLSALGLELQPASQVDGAGDQGVVITNVDSDSPAADRLSTGDIILEVGGAKVSSPRDVSQALAKAKDRGNRSVLLRVRSGDNAHYVAVPVERG